MGWGRRVLPWASIAVLVLPVTACSQAPRHKTDTTATATTAAATTTTDTTSPPPTPLASPAVHVSSPRMSYPVFVFPDALDEETRLRLMTPERNEIGYPNFQVEGWRSEAGGVPSAEAEVDGVRRSMSWHSVSVANKHSGQMRVLDVRAVVLERRPAFDGTLLLDTGLTPPRSTHLGIDLDQPGGLLVITSSGRPTLEVESMAAEEGGNISMAFSAFTSAHHYLWELRWTVQHEGSEPEELVIRSDGTADGPPFQTAAWGRDRHYSGGAHELHSGPCCYAG